MLLIPGLQQISNSRTFQFFGQITDRVKTAEKVVALTFDGGPTDEVLAMLAKEESNRVLAIPGEAGEGDRGPTEEGSCCNDGVTKGFVCLGL